MAEGRIMCVGTGNHLTNPSATAQGYENGRRYVYAPPGKLHRYKSDGVYVKLEESQCDQRYGLVVIEDFLITTLKQDATPASWDTNNEFIQEYHPGAERARDLAEQWRAYGAVLISGPLPTEGEIALGMAVRKRMAEERLDKVKTGQMLRRQGMKGYKPGYDPSDRAWASEFGVILPDTLESLERVQEERHREDQKVNCPLCDNPISPRARKCQFCQENFGMTVLDFMTAPKKQEVADEKARKPAAGVAAR